jgi:hypothetical protein
VQVVRALTIIWSLLMQCYYFPEFVVGKGRVIACLVVIVGFCIGSYGEINFNWIGMIELDAFLSFSLLFFFFFFFKLKVSQLKM